MDKVVIIDSGIGGLTVYNHLLELNCNNNITYLADNCFFPYGTKSDEELIKILDRILKYFSNNDYEHIFLACNTASVIYNKYFIDKYNVNVYPIIDNTVDGLINLNCLKVGVIGTNKTIESNVYQNRIKQLLNVEVISLACQELVSLCEKYNIKEVKEYIETNFNIFKEKQIDTLILGCTHFNVIKNELDQYFDNKIKIICSGYTLIESLHDKLTLNNNDNNKNSILITKKQHDYANIINNLFPNLKNIEINYLNI